MWLRRRGSRRPADRDRRCPLRPFRGDRHHRGHADRRHIRTAWPEPGLVATRRRPRYREALELAHAVKLDLLARRVLKPGRGRITNDSECFEGGNDRGRGRGDQTYGKIIRHRQLGGAAWCLRARTDPEHGA